MGSNDLSPQPSSSKMPKATTPISGSRQGRRHNPLETDLTATPLKIKGEKRKSRHQDEGDQFVDSKASRKILRMGQELADDDVEENSVQPANKAFDFESRLADDEEDEGPGTNLADLILEKIAMHEASQGANGDNSAPGPIDEDFEIPPKVVEVYTKVGLLLSRYKSGKLPKPFKILPTVPRWEDIIEITRPEAWTANAIYEATRIFVSSTPATAQRFFEMVVLERVREDIHETKKLNVHLFNALKKGLYKPAAWFKGFLFPLVGSGTCTLREAQIISAVLVRVSVPVLHSAAAIKGLCDIAAQESSAGTEGGGATNIFIKAMLEKKYALPYQVIDALVFHFLRFRTVDTTNGGEAMSGVSGAGSKDTKLPVIWHQCLLAFAQRYRNDITEDQREALLDLLLTKGHSKIGPEVRRELLEGRGRGIPLEPEALSFDNDDTMLVD